jgi:Ser-tRNA(Ala) deacylase AlaX
MTKKLYMEDPYLTEFEAIVLEINGNKIILDKTAFFAENGGQVGDTGYLNDIKVLDTKYDENKENILHILENPNLENSNFKVGNKIVGRIDWDRRYRIMKNHAASHIMEYFLFETFGIMKLIGTSVNEKYDSSTYEHPGTFDQDKLKKVEIQINEFISKGHEIERWEDPDKCGWLYWKSGEIMMHCGGTHPINTKEIGVVSIKRKNGGKGKEKILTSTAQCI